MKKAAFIICLFIASALALSAATRIGYLNILWGSSPDVVNTKMQEMDIADAEATVETVEIYNHTYPDPELVWYNTGIGTWEHFNFTTRLKELREADKSIKFLTQLEAKDFQRMVFRGEQLEAEGSWVYRFYFYKERLFAVSLRYENLELLEQFKERNPEMENVHPGYDMPRFVFQRNFEKMKQRFGGFDFRGAGSLDEYSSTFYGGWFREGGFYTASTAYDPLGNEYPKGSFVPINTMITLYYIQYRDNKVNVTISYAHNKVLGGVFKRLQDVNYDVSFPVEKEVITF